MNLTNLFCLHALLAALYAIALMLAPQLIVGLLSPLPLDPLSTIRAQPRAGSIAYRCRTRDAPRNHAAAEMDVTAACAAGFGWIGE